MCYLQVEQEARDEGRLDAGMDCFGVDSISYSESSLRDWNSHFCEDGDIAVTQTLERDMDLGG